MCRFNSLIGAKPSRHVSHWSDVLRTPGLEVTETWEEDYVLVVNTEEQKLLSEPYKKAATPSFSFRQCAIFFFFMSQGNTSEQGLFCKASNWLNSTFFFYKSTQGYISLNLDFDPGKIWFTFYSTL